MLTLLALAVLYKKVLKENDDKCLWSTKPNVYKYELERKQFYTFEFYYVMDGGKVRKR